MKIKIKDIVNVSDLLCKHLEDSGCKEIDLSQLSYWSIPKEFEYDVYNEPATHTLGSIDEDWEELKKISEGASPPVGYGLVWLASLLRAIGQNVAC